MAPSPAPSPADELVFLPLGGCNEIGMNLNAYGYGPPERRRWLVVDVGVTFGREGHEPGIDLITPDPAYLAEQADQIDAIVLTHAHEDHIGAIAWLWPQLKAPVYATPFTAYLVREKLRERGLEKGVKLKEIPLGGRLEAGPFACEFVTLTHSIPEPNGLVIRTPLGVIWHTGDWKIDPTPLIGAVTDEETVRRLGREGVLAMMCDSTNVFTEGRAGSEADVRAKLIEVVGRQRGRVAITAFASNVARVESAIEAARAAGRSVCLVGRSMRRIVGAARHVGLLQDAPAFVGEEEAGYLPVDRVLYLCTGSQGEARAALARIAMGDHRHVSLGAGDTVIFSSRVIPGNEHAIYQLYDLLVEKGCAVITDRDEDVHVSGHPCREELAEMYAWARPRIAVPVHGERRHIAEHVRLARALQTPFAIAAKNGDLVRLAPGEPDVIDEVPAGRLFVDGQSLVEEGAASIRDRKRLAEEGQVTVTLAVSARKRAIAAGPEVRARGLPRDDEERFEDALDDLAAAAETAFERLPAHEREDEDAIEAALVRAVRKAAERAWGKRPLVEAVVMVV